MSKSNPPPNPTTDNEGERMSISSHTSLSLPVGPLASTTTQQDASASPPPITTTTTSKNPSLIKRIWAKIGINGYVAMIMIKPALAAAISMAIYQIHAVAAIYLNFGYLIVIISITTVPILPRGKFLMNLFVTVFLTCLAASMVLLGQYAGIKAREHTVPAGSTPEVARGYNSSASVVNAIFLLFSIFFINTLRAARPVLYVPSIQYTVFVTVGFTYGPNQYSLIGSQLFVKEVLYAFLTGQAISTVVCLLVIPISSRKVFFAESTSFFQSCQGLLKKQIAFVEGLETSKLCRPVTLSETPLPKYGETTLDRSHVYDERLAALKVASTGLLVLGAKLKEDVVFAKRETAFGHLRGKDIHKLYSIIRRIMIPISGLSTIADISERMHDWRQQVRKTVAANASELSQETLDVEHQEWLELIGDTRGSFENMAQLLDESLVHILAQLKLVPASKKKTTDDPEKGVANEDASVLFGDRLERRIEEFRKQRSTDLHTWAQQRGLDSVFQSASKRSSQAPLEFDATQTSREALATARLHIILYMEYLLYSVSKAILAAVRFADTKVQDGTMTKKRFILPPVRTITKWLKGLVNGSELATEDVLDPSGADAQTIQLGDSFNAPRDPEHLPPKNALQRFGNHIRLIPKFFGSAPVKFGFRVSIAVMSIAILAYLKDTRVFFVKQRVVWCLVMVSIGMSPTTGTTIFNLFGNLIFTLVGMIGAFINWYIVDEKTAGVIPVFFVFMMLYFYMAARNPRFLSACVAGALTHVLIIGYELQTRVIGIARSTATGQPFYPIYQLAPYRLLVVGAGVLIGYIWTIFPSPITEVSALRRDLGGSLFLLANYLSSVSSLVELKLRGDAEGEAKGAGERGDLLQDHTGMLEKENRRLLGALIRLLDGMRANLVFIAWEPRLGGEFPRRAYEGIVDEVQSITNYLTIISYAASSLTSTPTSPPTWLQTHTSNQSSNPSPPTTSHHLISLFTLLSASISNGSALPPFIGLFDSANTPSRLVNGREGEGEEEGFTGKLVDTLNLQNVNEDGYRAIAVIEVARGAVGHSVKRIVGLVRELVGEVGFGLRVLDGGRSVES